MCMCMCVCANRFTSFANSFFNLSISSHSFSISVRSFGLRLLASDLASSTKLVRVTILALSPSGVFPTINLNVCLTHKAIYQGCAQSGGYNSQKIWYKMCVCTFKR